MTRFERHCMWGIYCAAGFLGAHLLVASFRTLWALA